MSENVVMIVGMPFVEHSDVDMMRHEQELFVTVGPYRRSIVLPDSLRRRHVLGAKLHEGELRVTFGMVE